MYMAHECVSECEGLHKRARAPTHTQTSPGLGSPSELCADRGGRSGRVDGTTPPSLPAGLPAIPASASSRMVGRSAGGRMNGTILLIWSLGQQRNAYPLSLLLPCSSPPVEQAAASSSSRRLTTLCGDTVARIHDFSCSERPQSKCTTLKAGGVSFRAVWAVLWPI